MALFLLLRNQDVDHDHQRLSHPTRKRYVYGAKMVVVAVAKNEMEVFARARMTR